MSLASFGAIAGGINQGMDMNRRDEQLKEALVTNNEAVKGLSKEEVDSKVDEFTKLSGRETAGNGDKMEED